MMSDDNSADRKLQSLAPTSQRQFILLALVVIALLFAAYWFFLRTVYEPILTGVAETDSADIVKVLDEKKIPYKLADGGKTILVASEQADKARVEIVGSELPMRGQVGFELFNQSDMGLTEFAQKINYQRALQGELARTILLLDGIQSVRVHLGLPERSLFRDEQSVPKASVTLILRPGASLTESRVAGVQRMVAGAIPDMTPDAVAIMDGTGRVVSQDSPVAMEQALEDPVAADLRERAQAAISAEYPRMAFSVVVGQRLQPSPATVEPDADVGTSAASPAAEGERQAARVIRIMTPVRLDEAIRADISRIIAQSIDIDRKRGDIVLFIVGAPVPLTSESPAAVAIPTDRVVASNLPPVVKQAETPWAAYWPWAVGMGVAAILAAIWSDRRRKWKRRPEQLASFAEQLRERLAQADTRAG